MALFHVLDGLRSEAVEVALGADDELGDAVVCDVALDGFDEARQEVGRRGAVTDEEASFDGILRASFQKDYKVTSHNCQ